jgi:triosephosphate isomerase
MIVALQTENAHITAMSATIRAELDGTIAEDAPILYGGSVQPANSAAILPLAGISGVLVGGACLDAQQWTEIVKTAKSSLN